MKQPVILRINTKRQISRKRKKQEDLNLHYQRNRLVNLRKSNSLESLQNLYLSVKRRAQKTKAQSKIIKINEGEVPRIEMKNLYQEVEVRYLQALAREVVLMAQDLAVGAHLLGRLALKSAKESKYQKY